MSSRSSNKLGFICTDAHTRDNAADTKIVAPPPASMPVYFKAK
jgi:hypothetical protein